jgi:hypothetical protein
MASGLQAFKNIVSQELAHEARRRYLSISANRRVHDARSRYSPSPQRSRTDGSPARQALQALPRSSRKLLSSDQQVFYAIHFFEQLLQREIHLFP